VEIIGKIIQKLELQSGMGKTGNSWQKQEFIVETVEQYPKKVCLNLWGDKVDTLAHYQIGDPVVASINIESKEYNGRWYTEVRCWKLEKQLTAQPATVASQSTTANYLPQEDALLTTFTDEGDNTDLPF
jgi:hypothetical protein